MNWAAAAGPTTANRSRRSTARPRSIADSLRRVTALVAWFACTAEFVPAGVRIAVDAPQRITIAVAGSVLSTATVCPNYEFDTLGVGGPTLSPDLHWILIDVRGPFEPADVPVTHALIQVTTGALVTAPDFPAYVGVPSTRGALAWASGERATLRYGDGKLATVKDPPLRALPALDCSRPLPL